MQKNNSVPVDSLDNVTKMSNKQEKRQKWVVCSCHEEPLIQDVYLKYQINNRHKYKRPKQRLSVVIVLTTVESMIEQ